MQLLALRRKAGLTQEEMADRVGVSEKAIRNWEGGTSYPGLFNLQKLIETLLFNNALTPGHERDEARTLWEQASESASRSIGSFDEQLFATVLEQHRTRSEEHVQETSLGPVLGERGVLLRDSAITTYDVSSFYGRENELAELERWILIDHCRVAALLGMGGIGKTTLAIKFAQQMSPHFEFVLECSLRNAPPLEEVIADCIQVISKQHDISFPQDTERRITFLLKLLQERRCLLVFDNVDAILQAEEFTGRYRENYEEYGSLIARIVETRHQSCLLLTSREMPGDLELLQSSGSPIRTLMISGLEQAASQELLRDKDLFGTREDWKRLVQNYAGNPLSLKIAASTVQEVFGGSIAAFLHEGPVILHTIRQLLDYQFERLSPLEKDLMYWLAVESDLVALEDLTRDLIGAEPRREVLAALQSLRWRCLVERAERAAAFILHDVVLEYVSERLVEKICDEIIRESPALLLTHALMKAQSKDYIRDGQVRVLLKPILSRLLTHYGGEQELGRHLMRLAQQLREKSPGAQGYGGGNLVNLLACLRGRIQGADFSRLLIRQAHLQGIEVQDTSFAESDVSDSLFTEPMESIASMALSRDGNYLAVGGFSGQIRIWRVADGMSLSTFRGHTGITWALAFSPDSTLLASGGYDRSVKLWQIEGECTGRCLATLQAHEKWVRTVAFSPNGTLLATGGDDETVRIWDVRGGRCLSILHGHSDRVLAVAFHPHGDLLTSGGEDGQIRVWSVRNHHEVASMRLHTRITSLAFNREGNLLASGSDDGTVEVWQMGGESNLQRLRVLPGHRIWFGAVAFGSGGMLASVSDSGKVTLWDAVSGKGLRTFQGYSSVISTLAFNPEGNLLAQGDDNGKVRIWEVGGEGKSGCLSAFQAHAGRIWSLAFHPNGRVFATGGEDQSIKLWEIGSGDEAGGRCLRLFFGHTVGICSLAFSPNGKLLASSSFDRTVKLWQVGGEREDACLQTLQGHGDFVWSVAFSPDGKLLASGDNAGEIRLWEVESGRYLTSLHSGISPLGALTFISDGTMLISSSNNEEVKLWEVSSGRCLTTWSGRGLANWIRAMAFSQHGTMLAIGSNDHTIKLWQLEVSGTNRLGASTWLGGRVWSLAFSPDVRLLASGDDNGTVIVCNIQTGSPIQVMRSERPYERLNIRGVRGLTEAQKSSLRALGAIEDA
ncbi:MAG TPA: NB-ARC domain-containing protein [Ktedonobacteraceae bacterium]|nr:NB-ARC domain-containing protein [Ktedonobacteraceae bacterium]